MSNKFTSVIHKLLPSGKAWNKEDGSNLDKIAQGISEEFMRIERRGNELIMELDPTRASELLPDWENLLSLPDVSFGEPDSAQERRNLVVLKLSLRGGQSRQYFIDLIKKLGFDIEIDEYLPFRAGGSSAGDALNNDDDWRHTWGVKMLQAAVFYFRAGESSAGDSLASYRNSVVTGIIDKLKPAHTHVIFSFVEE
jgi:uncharacterized protein YmfQ (DUF2313 family)